MWQYLPQLSHDNVIVFFVIVRLHCRHLATNGRRNSSTIPLSHKAGLKRVVGLGVGLVPRSGFGCWFVTFVTIPQLTEAIIILNFKMFYVN